MCGLRFGVLGPLEVHADGHPLPVPAGRRRAVLGCLLVSLGRPVPADTLVEAAWGEELPRDPKSALHTVLSRLRAVLGPDVVVAQPGGYRLDVPASAVDAQEFEQLAQRATTAETAEAGRLLEAALALWRGPAYADFADAGFATVEAQRLERLRLDTIEARASAATDGGDAETAVAVLEELLAEHPFRERAVELLMTALYHAGRQADALERYRHHRTLLADELGLDPSPALVDLEARILGHGLAPPERGGPVLPPAWLDTSTAFVGRDDALADLVHAVAASRVVTVTGPGGVGKSRLVAEGVPLLGERLRLPITVVELAGVSPGRTAAAVADALGLRPNPDSVVDGVLEHLGDPRLVVFDSCEHLLDEVSPLVTSIARRCPRVHVLATSRRRLGTGSERVLPLGTLAVPGPGDPAEGQGPAPAVRLFTDRVRRLRPAFVLTADNVDAVADLCRRVDGLPLALELAASRAATLGVGAVRERLPDGLVDEDAGDLHAVVAWSHRLLDDDQRRLLAALSVFAGDVDIDAVRGLATSLPGWRGDPAEALSELAEASLVSDHHDGDGMRYRMLEVVRAFAAQRLAESGEEDAAHLAHAEWVRGAVEQVAGDWTRGDGAVLAARLERLHAEVAAAVTWALAAGHTALAAALARAVMRCLHWTPGVELGGLLTEVAERAARTPGPDVAGGVAAGAFFLADRGDHARARQLAQEALRMSGEGDELALAWLTLGVASMYAGDHDESAAWFGRLAAVPRLAGEGHTSLALLACYAGDLTAAREHAAIALATGSAHGDASHAFARYAAGEVEARTDPDRGAVLLAEAAAQADRVGAEQVGRVARVALFSLMVRGGRHDEAAGLGMRLLRELRRMGVWPQLWTTLRMVAELLAVNGRHPESALLLGAAARAPSAPPLTGDDVARYAALESELSGRLGEHVMAKLVELAASLPRAQVVNRAEQVLAGLGTGTA